METVTRKYQVFTFGELSDSAKQTALQWNSETLHDEWSDFAIDDAKAVGALMGWDISSVYWSGFWSQGDGACFVGTMGYSKGCARAVREYAPRCAELHAIAAEWQALQRKHFYKLQAHVTHSGHYSHEYCARFEMSDYSDMGEKETAEIGRRFMRWIYRQLEKEYEYQTSAECFAETADANNWRFTENGKFFGGAE